MSDPVWYRSLYWRIAVGFVALLATVLVVQGFVFAWMTGRMTEFFPSRSPAQVALSMANDVADALADPSITDLRGHINSRYASSFRGFVVVLHDNRVIESERVPPPPNLVRMARGRLSADRPDAAGSRGRDGDRGRDDRDGRGGRGSGGRGDGRRGMFFGRGGPAPDEIEFARVILDREVMGMVAVPIEPPPLYITLQRLGPTLAVVALALLAAGTAIAAFVIVGPTRRRLQQLQHAAMALGAGRLAVRAPVSGGDEVTALSRVFNEMASQLESRTRALEQGDRTRRQLLADVSHELMTPLSAIRGYVETLSMDDLRLDDAARRRYLGIVTEEAGRLEHIIGDLLDLARLEGGGGAFRIEQVAPDQLLERVRRRHGPVLEEKQVTLTTKSDPAIDLVQADPNRLEQALQNLVANAVRHTPRGGRVSLEIGGRGDEVAFIVQDSGPGIPYEHLPHVFDRFYKADESRSGTEVPSGSGLGLSIVQAIVARHGGSVSASNAPEGGARFEIVLPKAPDAAAGAPHHSEPPS